MQARSVESSELLLGLQPRKGVKKTDLSIAWAALQKLLRRQRSQRKLGKLVLE